MRIDDLTPEQLRAVAARAGSYRDWLDRLHRRINEIAAVIRDPIAAQSAFRLDKFEQAVGLKPVHPSPGERPYGFNHPAHEIKRFIDKRAQSVRRQLDGKSKGMILKYPEQK